VETEVHRPRELGAAGQVLAQTAAQAASEAPDMPGSRRGNSTRREERAMKRQPRGFVFLAPLIVLLALCGAALVGGVYATVKTGDAKSPVVFTQYQQVKGAPLGTFEAVPAK